MQNIACSAVARSSLVFRQRTRGLQPRLQPGDRRRSGAPEQNGEWSRGRILAEQEPSVHPHADSGWLVRGRRRWWRGSERPSDALSPNVVARPYRARTSGPRGRPMRMD
jgi:hypothetical protein